jgi:hypothetical protein
MPPATRTPSQRIDDVAALGRAFPILEELHIQGFRRDDQCEYIVNGRGAFSTAEDGANCNIFTEPALPFDPRATADFERVSEALDAARIGVKIVGEVGYDSSGAMRAASFDFGDTAFVGQTYIFDPAGTYPVPTGPDTTYTKIDALWFMLVDPVR